MGKKSPPPHPPTGFNGQNNGPNLLDHIVNPNNFQQKPYDPYSINLHSEDHLNPLNPHNILSPNNLNNQYGTNPYTNNQFGNQYGGYNPYPNNNPYGYGKWLIELNFIFHIFFKMNRLKIRKNKGLK